MCVCVAVHMCGCMGVCVGGLKCLCMCYSKLQKRNLPKHVLQCHLQ